MARGKRTQSPVATTGDKATLWGRATPAGELRAYRWFRRANRAGLALGAVTSCVLAIGRHGVGVATCVVLMVVFLPVGFLIEVSLRPRGGDKPVAVRQAALDRKAAAHSAKAFRRGSAHPRRIDYPAPAESSPDRFAARADIVYQRACSEIRWDGNALRIIDPHGGVHVRSVSSDGVESDFLPPAMGSRKSVTTAPLANPVVVALALLKPASRPIGLLVLLDSCSRHLGVFDVRGFSESAISDVARKAGVELSLYQLPSRFGSSQEALAAAMFPESVFHRQAAWAR